MSALSREALFFRLIGLKGLRMTRSGMADRSPCRLLAYFAAGEFRSRKRQAGSEAGKASQPMGYSWRQRLGQAARSPTWAIPVPRVPGHRSLAGVAVRRRGGRRGRLRWPRGFGGLGGSMRRRPGQRIASSGGSNYEAHSSTALKLIGQASACSRSGRPRRTTDICLTSPPIGNG